MSSLSGSTEQGVDGLLREVVETLAELDRTPCSAGERAAAEWLGERLKTAGAVSVALEDEDSWGTFPPTSTGLGLLGVAGAILVLRGRRLAGTLAVGLGVAGILDEAQNGPRLLRRLVRRRRRTVNVVAEAGDLQAPRTLVVIAHHDAPQTGILFDQTLQRRLYERDPERMSHAKKPLPQWWIGLAGPLCTLAAAATGRRRLALGGVAIGTAGAALVADVWRSPTVAGANDNLSGVAVLVALAELLRDEPSGGLRVLLVSCGAEETLQDGIRAFVARHGSDLPPERTSFVNLDTVGSPHLVMLEGEGPIWMEEYTGPWLRDALADSAEYLEIPLERGFRARASTDSIIPSRAGYPIATLLSLTDWRSPANYHLPSDVPANLDYRTVAQAARLVHELIRRLAADSEWAERGDDATVLS
jgi:Peptidase family M28